LNFQGPMKFIQIVIIIKIVQNCRTGHAMGLVDGQVNQPKRRHISITALI